jgi:hypothetical protein
VLKQSTEPRNVNKRLLKFGKFETEISETVKPSHVRAFTIATSKSLVVSSEDSTTGFFQNTGVEVICVTD